MMTLPVVVCPDMSGDRRKGSGGAHPSDGNSTTRRALQFGNRGLQGSLHGLPSHASDLTSGSGWGGRALVTRTSSHYYSGFLFASGGARAGRFRRLRKLKGIDNTHTRALD